MMVCCCSMAGTKACENCPNNEFRDEINQSNITVYTINDFEFIKNYKPDVYIVENEELIQYYIVNKDLNMSNGKVSAQVAHASTLLALEYGNDEKFKSWIVQEMRKVVLEAHEKDMWKLASKLPQSIRIVDNGYTEIPAGSFTVLGLPIMTRDEAKTYVKRFQLLK